MTGKRKPSDTERDCVDAVDDAEREITDELLKEFGVVAEPDFAEKATEAVITRRPPTS